MSPRTTFNSPSYRTAAWSWVSNVTSSDLSLTGTAITFLACSRLRARNIQPSLLLTLDALPRQQFDTVINFFTATPLCLNDGTFF